MPRGVETILLVEDDALARQVIGRKLAELGYRVLEAADGEEALRLLERDGARPDLLLCDIVLPGVGARQVAGVARARARRRAGRLPLRPPGVAARAERAARARGPLLAKSLGPEEIARRLRDVLDGAVLE